MEESEYLLSKDLLFWNHPPTPEAKTTKQEKADKNFDRKDRGRVVLWGFVISPGQAVKDRKNSSLNC